MMHRVYMVQGSYGRFGLTSAMFRRCEEFINRGVDCISLTLDFTENIYSYLKENESKIPKQLKCLNPYIELSESADTWRKNKNINYIDNYLFTFFNPNSNSIEYYKTNGLLWNELPISNDRIISTITCPKTGIISKTYHFNQYTKRELNFSESGLCISIRDFDIKNNKALNMLVFDYKYGVINQYSSSYKWNVAWMENKIIGGEGVMIICDGPGTARKLPDLKIPNLYKSYVIHHNHRNSQNQITERDLWNLNNSHKFDAIIALTEQHKKDLKTDFDKGNFYTIPNFTKLNKHNNLYNKPLKFKIGFFGQLNDGKGVKDAIEAINLLHKKYNILAKLDFFGSTANPKNLEKTIKQYYEKVIEYGLEEYIHFRGYTSNVVEEMIKCSCLVFPSKSEAQPLVIVESMSLGIPVVSYNCKYGPSSMIEHGIDGYLCDVGDIDSLAYYLHQILSDDTLRNKLSTNAKEHAKQFTNSDYIFQLWDNLL